MSNSEKIPENMHDKFNSLRLETDKFSDQFLNEEYKGKIHSAIAALCRKRPSPLENGKDKAWAAGVVYAVGAVNFLFDKTQSPHCKATDISEFFEVGKTTAQAKSKEISDLLGMYQLAPEWTLPSLIDSNPNVWMVKIDGFIMDIRDCPINIQEEAFKKGIIPYVPVVKK
jgi:hypothetical protein